MMKPITLIDSTQLQLIFDRLCHQLIENHQTFQDTVLIGLQPRGAMLAQHIQARLEQLQGTRPELGIMDVTFFRDDFNRRNEPLNPNTTSIDFIIEDKNVVLIDDVLYTGRTIRAGLDAMLSYGRPRSVELLVLVDRRFSRELPIEPNYVGRKVDSIDSQKVKVDLGEDLKKGRVTLFHTKS